jgi:hypothetical protein
MLVIIFFHFYRFYWWFMLDDNYRQPLYMCIYILQLVRQSKVFRYLPSRGVSGINLLPSWTHRRNIHSVHFCCVACGTALMHCVLYENIIYLGRNLHFASKNNVVHGDLPTILFWYTMNPLVQDYVSLQVWSLDPMFDHQHSTKVKVNHITSSHLYL